MQKRKKTLLVIAVVFLLLFGLITAVYLHTTKPKTIQVNITEVTGEVFLHYIGEFYFSDENFANIALNWIGDGSVMFFSSTSELNNDDILELMKDGFFTFDSVAEGMSTQGSRRTINNKDMVLERAHSTSEIRWGLSWLGDGSDIYSYCNKFFYIASTDTENVSNITGKIEIR